MAITASLSNDTMTLSIAIEGRFDFSTYQHFRGAYENCSAKPQHYRVDMQNTTYLDSSALGMLLLLRDHAAGEQAEITIVNCNPDVRKILSISNFEQLFAID